MILDAISQVTGVRENFPGFPGRRALQLPDAAVDSYFLTAFGRPPRVTAADSERQQEPSITQALHVINGDTINRKLRAPRGLIQKLVDGERGQQDRRRTDLPRGAEPVPDATRSSARCRRAMDEALARGAAGSSAAPACSRIWRGPILTGREFLFNH